MIMRSYEEMLKFKEHGERLEYLRLNDNNYSSPRNESQTFFKSQAWKQTRKEIIARDMGFDLGVFGIYIPDKTIVHHINPITIEDILSGSDALLDPNNLITVSMYTHNLIHYSRVPEEVVDRSPGDTILW